MIDPMANLDPTGSPDMMMMGGSPTADDSNNNQEVFDMDAFRYNFRKMDKIRSFMGIVSGCVAGVLGLTGISGLGEYIVQHMCEGCKHYFCV
jgi:hypothetical protein